MYFKENSKFETRNSKHEARNPALEIHYSSLVTRHLSLHPGFTLLEIMIALAIIGITLVTVLHTANYHAGVSYDNTVSTQMTQLAKEKMHDLETSRVNSSVPPDDTGISYENKVSETGDPEIIELRTVVKKHGREITLTELVTRKEAGR